MESSSKKTKRKSLAGLVILILIAVGYLLFGVVAVICGFVINYHDDFEATDGGLALESTVEAQFDYTQYWLGIPFLIAAVFSLCSAMFQRIRSLTTVTIIIFHICIILSLFAMVLEGVDWVTWKNLDRERRKMEDKDGYSCSSPGYSCVCTHIATNKTQTISSYATCSNITSLSGLFGAIVASAIIGIFLSLAGIVVMLKSFSWKPHHYFVEYNLQQVNPGIYRSYKNEGYANGLPPRLAGKGGSVKEIPAHSMY